MRRILIAALVLGGCALVIAYGVWPAGGGDAANREEERRTGVVVVPAALAPVQDRVEAVGTVRPRESVLITAESEGVVRDLAFADGATVTAGTVLVRLDSAIQEAERASARAALEEATAAFQRAEELRQRGTVSQAALDEAVSRLRTAKANAALADTRLDKRTITAPFDGVLSFRAVSPGAYVRPGDAIATLFALDPVEVEFRLPEQYLGRLDRGQALAAVSRAYPDVVFAGTLEEVDTAIDPATRQLVARARFPNLDLRLRPGLLVRLDLVLETRERIVLPVTALVSVGPSTFVFVAGGDGTAGRRPVTIARRMGEFVALAEGLSPGDRVVVDGAAKLSDGDAIEVLPPEASPVAHLLDPQVAQRAAARQGMTGPEPARAPTPGTE